MLLSEKNMRGASCAGDAGTEKQRKWHGRKGIAAFAVIFALILSLAGCGGGNDGAAKRDTAEKELLAELDGIKIYSTGYSETGEAGLRNLGLAIESEGEGGRELAFRNGYVNGYLMDFDVYSTYEDGYVTYGGNVQERPGETVVCELMMNDYEFERAGIDTVAELGFTPELWDSETMETKAVGEPVRVVLQEGYVQEDDESGALLCDEEGIKVFLRNMSYDELMGYSIDVFVENNSDEGVFIQSQFCYVDGEEQESLAYTSIVPAGMRSVDYMGFMEDPEEGIREMEISLRVSDLLNDDAGLLRFITPLVKVDLENSTVLGEREVELSDFDGVFAEEIAGRGTINIRERAVGKYGIEVSWGSSAWESRQWYMSAEDDGNGGIVYTDCYCVDVTYDEDTDEENYEDVYDDGSGRMWFDDEGKLVWESDKGDVDGDSRFVRAD